MTASTFQDKLKDLNLTGDEMKRFSDAFQNAEFRKLFIQYAEELNDPKNRELYEQEIRAAEQQRGSDVTFIHPNAGHVLKTTIGDKTKCFINIAMNEHVDKPSYAKTDGPNGKKGAQWSLPHCLAGPHEDLDHESKSCTVYDVIFSPDTYRMGETNEKFMNMIDESALDSVEKNYNCKLDRKNVKRLKMKFKGVPKATILRKKQENFVEETEKQLKNETDEIIDKALSAAQNHKVILSNHNRSTNNNSSPPASITPPETNTPRTDENGFTVPTYRIVHRGEFDMQDCTNSLVPQVHSMRPKELLVEIDLPLCASSSNVDLDVCERSLKLHCDSPKYSLDLPLSYPVRESDSHARFDKKQRKLLVVLAVIKEISTIIEMQTNTPPEETNEETAEVNSPIPATEPAPAIEKPANVVYTSIPFEYKQGSGHLAIVIYVKNVDESSFKLDNDGQHVTIQLSSLGSGFYPLQHQLCLDFDEPMTFDTAESSSSIKFNDDNVLVILKKTSNNKQIDHFQSSVNRDDMKTHYSTVSNTPAPDKASTSSTQAMTKDDFLVSRSDSSTSLNGEQPKQLTKKQAKKMAKQKRKNSLTAPDSNDKLSNKISTISLESNTDEEKEEDKLPEMPKSIARPTAYRRHMSESQVELGLTSNGEFKLKGILKNSTKYRSYSASFSENFDNSNNDNQHEEPVFEACSTVDDLTSSNENNSIVTSPDSGGSSSLCTTPSSSLNVKHVTFNNQVSRKTFKPGGPVSGMRKLSSHQQRKLKKRKRQDSLNSQSSDPDDSTSEKNKSANQSNEYKNPVEFQDVIARQASGIASSKSEDGNASKTKSAVQFTNPLIFELDN